MPGYVIHMAVASKIVENKGITDEKYIRAFLVGNIIPDAMDRNNKKESHFWDELTYANLNRIPNLDDFLSKYKSKLNDPFVLGYYTHLMLDNLFVNEYWKEHFRLLNQYGEDENSYNLVKYIKVIADDKIYDRESFFSDELYYGDYDRMYSYIFKDWPIICIEKSELDCIPIDEINYVDVKDKLSDMIREINTKHSKLDYSQRESLKVLDLEHIYTLMNKVVSSVCGI